MKYRISKTAVLGPALYLGSLLFIFPYTFNKHNPGSHFKLSPIRAVLATVIWISLNITVIILETRAHMMILFTTTSVYFIPIVYSRQKILKCLNVAYKILRQIEYPPNVVVPFLIILTPLAIFCINIPTISFTINRFLGLFYLMDMLIFSMLSLINSLCFSVSIIFKDIFQQLNCLQKRTASTVCLAKLTKTQWQAYQLAQLISQAFGPFLMIYILYNSFLTFKGILTFHLHPMPVVILPMVYYNWSLTVLCFSSHNMNSQRTNVTNAIQKLMADSTITKEDYEKLAVMMEQARLGNLYISVLGFIQMDLPMLLTLANVIVTYLMILLEIV